jgi:hypothetical protein
MTVSKAAKHILTLSPQHDAATLAIYHYLKNCRNLSEPLSAELFNDFFRRALSFCYWRQNREILTTKSQEVLSDLSKVGCGVDHRDLLMPDSMQVVPIDQLKDLAEIATKFFRKRFAKGEFRMVRTPKSDLLAIIKNKSHTITVYQLNSMTLVNKGALEPLCLDRKIEYGSDLEILKESSTNHIQASENMSIRFSRADDGFYATIIRGYTFQKIRDFKGIALNRAPELFYALKQLEGSFINRSTDPFYTEIITLLEQARTLLETSHPSRLRLAEAAVERGENCLRLVFPGDKVLELLIHEVTNALNKSQPKEVVWDAHPQRRFESIDF